MVLGVCLGQYTKQLAIAEGQPWKHCVPAFVGPEQRRPLCSERIVCTSPPLYSPKLKFVQVAFEGRGRKAINFEGNGGEKNVQSVLWCTTFVATLTVTD